MDTINIGLVVKNLRLSQTMTQLELAELLEVSESFIAQVESNESVLSPEHVGILAERFELHASYIKLAYLRTTMPEVYKKDPILREMCKLVDCLFNTSVGLSPNSKLN